LLVKHYEAVVYVALDSQETLGETSLPVVSDWILEYASRFAIDLTPLRLHGEAETVKGQELIRVATYAKNDVASRETLRFESTQNVASSGECDRVTVDQANLAVQHLVALGGDVTTKDVVKTFDGTLERRGSTAN
jgi:hypothetical protein